MAFTSSSSRASRISEGGGLAAHRARRLRAIEDFARRDDDADLVLAHAARAFSACTTRSSLRATSS
jgi:hypothetical protein